MLVLRFRALPVGPKTYRFSEVITYYSVGFAAPFWDPSKANFMRRQLRATNARSTISTCLKGFEMRG